MTRAHPRARRGLRGWSRLAPAPALALTLFLGATAVRAQAPAGEAHWLVLLDVSASFDQRNAALSARHGRDYQLRDELLALTEVLLFADHRMQDRPNRLMVYLFGEGVAPMETPIEVGAGGAPGHSESWWRGHIQTWLAGAGATGRRTDLPLALGQAVAYFQGLGDGHPRRLLLISDGELDVGAQNRPVDGPPGDEEQAAYRRLLDAGAGPIAWLRDQGVRVDTFAVEGDEAPEDSDARQAALGAELHRLAPGANASDAGLLARIGQSAAARRGGEGPYVLHALADLVGNGSRSWTVTPGNLLPLLTRGVLGKVPPGGRLLPPRTDEVILIALDAGPKRVDYRDGDQVRTAVLAYDRERGVPLVDTGGWPSPLQVQAFATSQTLTYRVVGPLVRVGAEGSPPGGGLPPGPPGFEVHAKSRLDPRWELVGPGQPPFFAGDPVRLRLAIRFVPGTTDEERDFWRRELGTAWQADDRLDLTDPAGQPLRYPLSSGPLPPDGDLAAVYETGPLQSLPAGRYLAQAVLHFGSPQSWPLDAQGFYFRLRDLPPLDLEWTTPPAGSELDPGGEVALTALPSGPDQGAADLRALLGGGALSLVLALEPDAAAGTEPGPGLELPLEAEAVPAGAGLVLRARLPAGQACGPHRVGVRLLRGDRPLGAVAARHLGLLCGRDPGAWVELELSQDGEPCGRLRLPEPTPAGGLGPVEVPVAAGQTLEIRPRLHGAPWLSPGPEALVLLHAEGVEVARAGFDPAAATLEQRGDARGRLIPAAAVLRVPPAHFGRTLDLSLRGLGQDAGTRLRLSPQSPFYRGWWPLLAAVLLATLLFAWFARVRARAAGLGVARFQFEVRLLDGPAGTDAELLRDWLDPGRHLIVTPAANARPIVQLGSGRPLRPRDRRLVISREEGRFMARVAPGSGWQIRLGDAPRPRPFPDSGEEPFPLDTAGPRARAAFFNGDEGIEVRSKGETRD